MKMYPLKERHKEAQKFETFLDFYNPFPVRISPSKSAARTKLIDLEKFELDTVVFLSTLSEQFVNHNLLLFSR